uniref:Sushi domain-containing protein n=1 Tax=Cyanoderma ruficeps TaxID=181631 RepID=A0A8C3XDD9_9PASS
HYYRTRDTVTVTCNPGYALRGSPSSTCGASKWSPPLPECKKGECPRGGSGAGRGKVTCPRPPSIANGLHSGHALPRFPRGLTVSYSCKEGFELLGNVSITCTDSGLWSRPLPRCEVRPCPMPPEVANANHNGQDKAFFTAGMSVRYSCNPGYFLVGKADVFCRASGNWSQPLPRCEGESGLGPLRGQTPRVQRNPPGGLIPCKLITEPINVKPSHGWGGLRGHHADFAIGALTTCDFVFPFACPRFQ